MTQLEIEVKNRYTISRGDDTEEISGIDMQRALDFIDGYHQAEKDLELTLEDIERIFDIHTEIKCKDSFSLYSIEFYQEVLKRFLKNKKV